MKCVFCDLDVLTREHHIVPRSKKGKVTVSACETCENYIHKTWTHNELRDTFNSVSSIQQNDGFQKFLKWRRKQSSDVVFKSKPNRFRDKNPYR